MHLKWILVLTAALAWTGSPAFAHSDDADDDHLAALIQLHARGLEVAPRILAPTAGVPSIRVGGQVMYLNGPFWEYMQGWTRAYYHAIQNETDDAIPMSEEQFVQLVDVEAKGFVRSKVGEPLIEGLEHIVVGTADLGATLGPGGAVVKTTGEVTEFFVSKALGGGGMHYVCHLIDAAIIFGYRGSVTMAHTLAWAPTLGASGVATLIRMGFISGITQRAQRRVRFESGPVELSPEDARELDAEKYRAKHHGKNLPDGYRWGFFKEGKTSRWLRKFDERGEGRLKQKVFLGKRFKRFLWLRARRTGYAGYIGGAGSLDKTMGKDFLWIMSAQENVIQRGFTAADVPTPGQAKSLAARYTPEHDEVREGLAAEFAHGDPAKAAILAELLRDVELVFNPAIPRKLRYAHVRATEASLLGVKYANYAKIVGAAGELYQAGARGLWGKIKAIKQQWDFHWKSGRFSNYILDVGDYLRVAALQNDPEALAEKKYEVMDAMKRIFDTFEASRDLSKIATVRELVPFAERMKEARQSLMTFTPWREKRAAYSWWPFTRPMPECHDLNRKATL